LDETTLTSRTRAGIGVAVLAATMAVAAVLSSAPARADYFCDKPINGVYSAVSDGQWAKTREVYHDEATVEATWTIASSCDDFMSCSGNVESDQGWSSPLTCKSGLWTVLRDHPDWQPCPDGSTTPGEQRIAFYVDRNDRSKFRGSDRTTAPSGGCGVNLPLTVDMPFRLTPVGH
jgi:hypothetical protein